MSPAPGDALPRSAAATIVATTPDDHRSIFGLLSKTRLQAETGHLAAPGLPARRGALTSDEDHFGNRQKFTAPRSSPLTAPSPSGVKASAVTVRACPEKLSISCCVPTSHSRTAPFASPLSNRSPSADKERT